MGEVKGSNSCYLLHTKGSYCCYLLHTKGSNPHGNFPIGSSTSLYSQLSPSGSASCSPAVGEAGGEGGATVAMFKAQKVATLENAHGGGDSTQTRESPRSRAGP